ncbi:MAG: cation-translocating P-type ATPase [Candidatus Hodarchaeales archaeon]
MDQKWHSISSDTALELLDTTIKGLTEEEAAARLNEYGFNEIKKEGGISPLTIFLNQLKDFLIVILIVSAVVSVVIGIIKSINGTGDAHEYFIDSIVILIIVILNALLGFYQEYKAEKAIEALKEMQEVKTIVIREEKEKIIPSANLVPGDIVELEAGNSVPADIRIIQSFNVKAMEAQLTGESVPVAKQNIIVPEKTLVSDRNNMTFMGTNVVAGRGVGVVVKTGMDTEIGEIARMISETEQEDTPLQKRLEKLGKQLGIVILLICAAVSIIGILRFNSLESDVLIKMFILGVSLAVAAIPEGLPAVVTLALTIGVRRMIKRNALIRKLYAVETLGSASVICSDKTGTITHNVMTVRKLWTPHSEYSITGRGWSIEGEFLNDEQDKTDPLSDLGTRLLLNNAILCNNARVSADNGKIEVIGDPTEVALVVMANKTGLKLEDLLVTFPSRMQFPFDSDRKVMSTVHGVAKESDQRYIFVKGAVDVLLEKCTHYIDREGESKAFTADIKEKILIQNQKYAERALRVLGFAYKIVSSDIDIMIENTENSEIAESDLTFLGIVGMIDPPREKIKESIEVCRRAGIKVKMITGDHLITAIAVAKEIGLIDDDFDNSKRIAMTGVELEEISEQELTEIIQDIHIFARVSPAHKLRIISALKEHKEVVVMTGDGVNDAPALTKADIGVSMGITGTDVAKEASEMILTDDNFNTIVNAIEEGRSIYDNTVKFISYLLSCNAAEVMIIFISLLVGLPLPLIAIQILWINLMTDALPALALGVSAAEPDVMIRSPRPVDQGILNRDTISNVIVAGIAMSFFTLLVFIAELGSNLTNPPEETLIRAQTAALTVLITFQLFHAINNSEKGTIFTKRIFLNKYLFLAVFISFALQLTLLYVPIMRDIFRTTALEAADLFFSIIVAFLIIPIDEVRKFVVKRLDLPSSDEIVE